MCVYRVTVYLLLHMTVHHDAMMARRCSSEVVHILYIAVMLEHVGYSTLLELQNLAV